MRLRPAAGGLLRRADVLPAAGTTPRAELEALVERTVEDEGQRLLGWRDVPVEPEHTGRVAGACRPTVRQLFVGAAESLSGDYPEGTMQDAFERKLYVIRRVCELARRGPVSTSRRARRGPSTTRGC